MSINDFKNTRGVNAEDPIYDKDVVNLRTLRRIINSSTSGAYTTKGTADTAMDLGNYRVVKKTALTTDNQTLTTTVGPAGTTATLIIVQTSTSSRTITFGTGFKPAGTLSTGTVANRQFVIQYVSDGTNYIQATPATPAIPT